MNFHTNAKQESEAIMAMNTVTGIQGLIPVLNILFSTADKTDLDKLVKGVMSASPQARFYSSTGTHAAIAEILGHLSTHHLIEVGEYTGYPEMDGGLVKTLHPKIHAGILGERMNQKHQQELADGSAVYFDMMVGNLYPFSETVAKPDCTPEMARGNIDIGGPTMIRGAAKNWHGCSSVCDPNDYSLVVAELAVNNGCISAETRFNFAKKAFAHTAKYDTAIASYMDNLNFKTASAGYVIH